MIRAKQLDSFYKKLYTAFGPQYWWPAETSFEVMVGSILTQNTSWVNVEKAIGNLKRHGLLSPLKLYRLPKKKLALFIRPAGYYNIKAGRLKNFLDFLFLRYQGRTEFMRRASLNELRRQLLGVKGIGQETADSILLYALDKPIFVIDAYTKRVLARHKIIDAGYDYSRIQNLFMRNLKKNVKLFNEYHALLVRLGKDYCLKAKPRCDLCPLRSYLRQEEKYA